MNFYMMECYEPDDWEDSAMLKETPTPEGESWRDGQRFVTKPDEPIEIIIDPSHSDDVLEFENIDALIMTKRLLKALQESGVDNLDIYKAVITNTESGYKTDDYVACKLIGLVSAADLSESKVVGGSPDGLIDVDFDSVKIDELKAKDHLLFRLVENTSAIVVHESVKNYIEGSGINTLDFVKPEDWIG